MLRPIAWTIGGLAIVVVAVVLAHAPETGFVDPPPARRGTSSADPIDARVNDPQRNAIESDVDEKSAASPSRTMTLRGRVVDEQGHGIEGARVMAFQTFDRPPLAPIELDRPFGTVSVARRTVNGVADTYWHFIGPLPPESRSGSEPMTRTSTDGSFRLEVPETTRLYPFADRFSLANAIAVNAPGRAPASFGVWEDRVGESIDTGDHVLQRGVALRGQVVDSRGMAVTHAVVLVGCVQVSDIGTGPFEGGQLSCGSSTDADGAFEFPNRPKEPHWIAVRHEGAQQFTVLDAGRPGIDARIVIPTTTALEVEVVDSRGAPIAKPFIRVVAAAGLQVFPDLESALQPSPARTIADGVFVVDDLIAGEVELLVGEATRGFVVNELTLPLARVRVEVPDSSPLNVQVVDRATGEPVREAKVVIGVRELESLVAQAHCAARGTTSAAGDVTLLRRVNALHVAHVEHPEYSNVDANVDPGSAELRVELQRAGSIVGRITENDAVVRKPMTVRVEGLSKSITDVRRDVPVDDSGTFLVDRLAAGRYAVRVRVPVPGVRASPWIEDPREWLAFVEAKVAPGEVARVDIDLTKGSEGTGLVRGRLTVNGVPTAAILSIRNERLPKNTVGSTRSDADGSFAFAPIPPGRSTLIVSRFIGEPSEHATDRSCEVMTLDVPRGQSIEVFPDLAVGTVVGSVVDLGGNPIFEANVHLIRLTESGRAAARDRPEAMVKTDRRGSYTIEWVPEGSYSVSAGARGFAKNDATSVTVARGGTQIHDITLSRGASVSGRIDAGGPIDPDFSVIVSLRRPSRPDENLPGIGIDRKTGSFSMPDLEPGRYELSVWWVKNATPRTPGPPGSEPRYVRFDGRSNTLLTKTIVVPEGGLKDLSFRIE
jgi:hypothetical protein